MGWLRINKFLESNIRKNYGEIDRMKKNEEFIITIEDIDEDGSGVGKQDGYIWFIKDTVIKNTFRPEP